MTTVEALQKTRRLVAEGEVWGLFALVPVGADEAMRAIARQCTAEELEHPENIVNWRRLEIVDAAIEQFKLKENALEAE